MEPSAVSTLPPAVANGSSSRDAYAAAAAGVRAGSAGCCRTGAVRARYCWESREVSGAKPTMKWSGREGDEIDGLLAEGGVEPPGEEVSTTEEEIKTTEEEIKTRKRQKSDDQ